MSKRVLIVDDEIELGEVIRDLLEIEGYDTTVVNDADSARERLAADSYDLAILDVMLADGPHGLDLANLVLNRYPDTRVILMTGYADSGSVRDACLAGVYSCLSKPFNLDDISRTVWMALETRLAA